MKKLTTRNLLSLTWIFILLITAGACRNSTSPAPDFSPDSIKSELATFQETTADVKPAPNPPTYIETVVSRNYIPPLVDISSPGLNAASLIVGEFNKWAAIKCSQKIDATLASKWDESKTKYIGAFPHNSKVLFLILVDKFQCNVIGMLPESQIVRVKDNVCSINDIKVDRPDLIYDPVTTGFFTVKVKF
ncbi:MAG: hypothetical protein JWQ09_4432 [Segetibacter sp.]|nr:hypothetical protein [Segetibacter sp.]